MLARVYRGAKPDILTLGPMCGESVVYLASRGARVHVDDPEPPPPVPPRRPGEPVVEVEPYHLDQPDARFDLVLAWEHADFVPPDRLQEWGRELGRIAKEGGMLFLLSHLKPPAETEPPSRYRLLSDDLIVRESVARPPLRRWVHPTRDLERALAAFKVQGIQLQRSQMREITAARAPTG